MRRALLMSVLFAAYVSAAKLGIELSVAHGVITPVWAPTGIALAALVLFGLRLWPAVALGAFVANVTSGAAPVDAAFIAVGNTLEAVVGGALLLRVGFRPAIDRVRDVFSLIVFGALVSTAIAATNGVTTLWISGEISGSDYGSDWLLWWIGDGMGDLIVAPLIFVLSTRPWRHLDLRDRLEGVVVLAALVALSATVFLGGQWRYPHLLFPVLIWATLRFQQLGAVTSSFVVAAFAVTGAVRGTALLGQGSTTEIVQILEGLTAGVAVSLLILGAVLAERSEAQRQLAAAHASLAEAQEVAQVGSWEWDIGANRVTWSDELYRLWGLEPQSVEMTYERYLDSVHPADREQARAVIERALESRAPFDLDHRVALPDGSMRWIHGAGRVIVDGSGAPSRMVGNGTGHHRAQADRRPSRLDPLGRLPRVADAFDVDHRLRDHAEGQGSDPCAAHPRRDGRAPRTASAEARPPARRPARPRSPPSRLRAPELPLDGRPGARRTGRLGSQIEQRTRSPSTGFR